MSDAAHIRRLRDRIDYLEEENRQLHERLAKYVTLPTKWRLNRSEATVFGELISTSVVSKERIMDALYGHRPDCDWPESGKIIDVHICNLRRKLKPFNVRIDTVHSRGWMLAEREKYSHLLEDVQ